MKIYSSLIELAALGALSSAAVAADTSAWKCETCPYPKGTTATVEVGAGTVSGSSAKFGDFSGLQSKGEHAILGGTLDYRSGSGYYAGFTAEDLGLDSRRVSATSGLEGVYQLRLGYGELPRHLSDSARTPFIGGSVLTLPAGYPASTSSAMPAASLQPVDISTRRQRFDLDGRFMAGDNFTYRVTLRRDVRDGTQATYGSFFSTTAQLPLVLDQTTDQLEVSAAYVGRGMHATVAYQLSQFKNDVDAVTWANPFSPLLGATRGQLAQAPDNKLQQLSASGGYEITPTIKLSGDIAVGRLTQDAAFLAPTLNAGLAPGALPAASLDGEVETFNGSLRLTAAPVEGLRLNASVARDRRDNRTSVRDYSIVTTDVFVNPQLRSNTPFGFTLDRIRLNADYRGPGSWKFSAGADHDRRERTYAEAVQTRETTLWGRASARPLDDMTVAVKLAHGKREHSTYGTATWFGSTENPLLRKFNLAERERDSVGLRTDFALTEKLTMGLTLDYNSDAYGQSLVGLRSARSFASALDMAVAVSEQTQLTAYVQGEAVTSRQRGSEAFAAPDWSARSRDQFSTFGLGIKHAAIADKLDLGADVSLSRSRSNISVANAVASAGFPEARTTQDSFKLYANVKLQDNLWLKLSGWYETYDASDWRLDGVLPATVQNLLSFGSQAPHYSLTVLRASLSYRF